ncbi:Golgi-associated kinase 1B-like [Entelurus aequoreus]|uniref:Golgi-associated kinase 1B-like n=1 Tax=Entelurus aequoreus TaxID=161455 RepID=UPI002B1DB233|nr:Golgi-associated kinase 1B-like [Entelurus aequoreus]
MGLKRDLSRFWFRRCSLPKMTLLLALIYVVYSCFGCKVDFGLLSRTGAKVRVSVLPNEDVSVPTRPNVVYITLKSNRLKPANIRGTIRPKLRSKARRITREHQESIKGKRTYTPDWRAEGAEPPGSPIRIYSKSAPPWLSARDVATMRALASARVVRVHARGPLLILEEEPQSSTHLCGGPCGQNSTHLCGGPCGQNSTHLCGGPCGLVHDPADSVEVFAFHLDRVLGLNRTLPAVSRKVAFLHDGQPSPVVAWKPSLYPDDAVRLTWGEYQRSLKQRCWLKNITRKPASSCSTIHHFEWSKMALFDFLLQIHNRLDPSCCGFSPRQQDACYEAGRHLECADQDRIKLANIVHRGQDPRHLVLTANKGYFDRSEDNLDFRLLEGIKELPERSVSVLRSGRLREKLLQSLFLDQTYWESRGGRTGIDKLIDVIERRAQVLLTYANAHGIAAVAMSE